MRVGGVVGSRGDLVTLNRPQASLRLGTAGHRLRSGSQLLSITSIGLLGDLLSQLTSLGLTLDRSLMNLRRLTSSRGDLITLNRPQACFGFGGRSLFPANGLRGHGFGGVGKLGAELRVGGSIERGELERRTAALNVVRTCGLALDLNRVSALRRLLGRRSDATGFDAAELLGASVQFSLHRLGSVGELRAQFGIRVYVRIGLDFSPVGGVTRRRCSPTLVRGRHLLDVILSALVSVGCLGGCDDAGAGRDRHLFDDVLDSRFAVVGSP